MGSKTVRVYLGVAVVAVIGLIVAVVTEQVWIGLIIVVAAGLGGMFLLRQTTADDEDEFFEAPEQEEEPKAPRASTATAAPPASEPLATWEPEGLTPWTPPESSTETEERVDTFDRADSFSTSDPFASSDTFGDDLDTVDLDDLEHLDSLMAESVTPGADGSDGFDRSDGFDAFDNFEAPPVETIEPERDSFANSMFGGGVSPIDEDVHSDDDIMAASHATELTVTAPGGADNSELAKLLAKVQSRLAAYE